MRFIIFQVCYLGGKRKENGQKGEEESRSIAQELETKRHDVRIDGESDI